FQQPARKRAGSANTSLPSQTPADGSAGLADGGFGQVGGAAHFPSPAQRSARALASAPRLPANRPNAAKPEEVAPAPALARRTDDAPDELAPSHHSSTASARGCDQRQGVQCVAM